MRLEMRVDTPIERAAEVRDRVAEFVGLVL
jgi:hypothetical protein